MCTYPHIAYLYVQYDYFSVSFSPFAQSLLILRVNRDFLVMTVRLVRVLVKNRHLLQAIATIPAVHGVRHIHFFFF